MLGRSQNESDDSLSLLKRDGLEPTEVPYVLLKENSLSLDVNTSDSLVSSTKNAEEQIVEENRGFLNQLLEKCRHMDVSAFISGGVQLLWGAVGGGYFMLFFKPSENCAADLHCVDTVLARLPKDDRVNILIVSGGTLVGFKSALCAMHSVPEFSSYLRQYSGITKWIKGGEILSAAMIATSEKLFIAMNAYPTISEALAAPTTWIATAGAFSVNIYGVLQIPKDLPYIASKINALRGRYQGECIEGNQFYQQLVDEYHAFQNRTANHWAELVPNARTIDVSDKKQDPLRFLFLKSIEMEPHIQRSSPSWHWKSIAYVIRALSIAASFGSFPPVLMNTYHVLQEVLAKNYQSPWMSLTRAVLAGVIGFPSMRTIIKKVIGGSFHFSDWNLSQDLEFQLYPKIMMISWLMNIVMANFSYAVSKSTALKNFDGEVQEPMAEIAGYSINFVHLMFGLQFISSLVARCSGNYLFEVQKEAHKVRDMILEEFHDFVRKLSPEDRRLYQINDSVLNVSQPGAQEVKEVIQPVKNVVVDIQKPVESAAAFSSKKRFAHRLCRWFSKENVSEELLPKPSRASPSPLR